MSNSRKRRYSNAFCPNCDNNHLDPLNKTLDFVKDIYEQSPKMMFNYSDHSLLEIAIRKNFKQEIIIELFKFDRDYVLSADSFIFGLDNEYTLNTMENIFDLIGDKKSIPYNDVLSHYIFTRFNNNDIHVPIIEKIFNFIIQNNIVLNAGIYTTIMYYFLNNVTKFIGLVGKEKTNELVNLIMNKNLDKVYLKDVQLLSLSNHLTPDNTIKILERGSNLSKHINELMIKALTDECDKQICDLLLQMGDQVTKTYYDGIYAPTKETIINLLKATNNENIINKIIRNSKDLPELEEIFIHILTVKHNNHAIVKMIIEYCLEHKLCSLLKKLSTQINYDILKDYTNEIKKYPELEELLPHRKVVKTLECSICLKEHDQININIPCKHACLCKECYGKLDRKICPYCKTNIEKFEKIFIL